MSQSLLNFTDDGSNASYIHSQDFEALSSPNGEFTYEQWTNCLQAFPSSDFAPALTNKFASYQQADNLIGEVQVRPFEHDAAQFASFTAHQVIEDGNQAFDFGTGQLSPAVAPSAEELERSMWSSQNARSSSFLDWLHSTLSHASSQSYQEIAEVNNVCPGQESFLGITQPTEVGSESSQCPETRLFNTHPMRQESSQSDHSTVTYVPISMDAIYSYMDQTSQWMAQLHQVISQQVEQLEGRIQCLEAHQDETFPTTPHNLESDENSRSNDILSQLFIPSPYFGPGENTTRSNEELEQQTQRQLVALDETSLHTLHSPQLDQNSWSYSPTSPQNMSPLPQALTQSIGDIEERALSQNDRGDCSFPATPHSLESDNSTMSSLRIRSLLPCQAADIAIYQSYGIDEEDLRVYQIIGHNFRKQWPHFHGALIRYKLEYMHKVDMERPIYVVDTCNFPGFYPAVIAYWRGSRRIHPNSLNLLLKQPLYQQDSKLVSFLS